MRNQHFDRETWRVELPPWCERALGARPARTLFEAGWQSAVVGVRLEDGREVVVKIRLAEDRLVACDLVHRHLYARGFPCPEPLVGPTPLGRYLATAERYDPAGEELSASDARASLTAGLLARLVRSTPRVADVPSLEPPPAWAWWSHPGPGLWPPHAEGHVDLNAHEDPPWLGEIVERAKARLVTASLPAVVGHCDWSSHNLRWLGSQIRVVHDWDSACALAEAEVAGMAASMFTTSGAAPGASLDESEAFLAAYETVRGLDWTGSERQAAWAVRPVGAKPAPI
jgi:Ser/Thr protein kinase RdoA (MazF antagonist)